MSKAHLLLIFLWVAYFAIHSGMAGNALKDWLKEKMGKSFRFYRLIYNIIAVVGLIFILVLAAIITTRHVFPPSVITKFIGLALASWGVIIIRLAFKHYDTREFLGINGASIQQSKLVVKGPSKYVRHPLYSGTILVVVGYWLFAPTLTNLVSLVCIFLYLFVGIKLEEKKLMAEFGEEYEDYRKNVPALLPHIKL